ncbi:MAG: hypothetical protein JSV66_10525 [Trueperaceae bacterium]|nr:MAG: hypothetical protein JSV66_10525 [Trueperaceae bacterium]
MSDRVVKVAVDATQSEPLRRIWRYVGYDEPNYTYTERGNELLGKLGRLADGPYFIRCHFLLCTGSGIGSPKWGSTNVYTEDERGRPVYDFTLVDRIFDTYLESGCTPFVELGFMPKALSTAPDEVPYEATWDAAWAYPPTDYGRWRDLIAAIAAHCLERYGLREVSRWYWELWNEPDIGYWRGTVQEYCNLYDYTVAGLHSILPQAYVGGPGTTSPARGEAGDFLRRFLQHCSAGTNAATGGRGTRLDFVSFHTKGGGYRTDDRAAKQTPSIFELVRHVAAGLDITAAFPKYRGLEVVLSECDPDGWAAGSRHDNWNLEFRNTEYYASYLANTVCQLMDLGRDGPNRVDGMLTWAFQFEDREYFEGLRTLSTNGVDKPVLNVLRLLARLGRTRLELWSEGHRDPVAAGGSDRPDTLPDLSGLAALDDDGTISVFLSCHHDDWDLESTTDVDLQLRGLEPGHYQLRRLVVDDSDANAYATWVEMGRPIDPTGEQIADMKSAARLRAAEVGTAESTDGVLTTRVSMKSHSVWLLELHHASDGAVRT